jgi:hypothetical protein
MRFEKYVSALALGSRWDAIATFSVAQEDVGDDDEADGDDDGDQGDSDG